MAQPRLAAIVAVAENGVIGRNNALPWYLPEDLRYFKRLTLGKPVIMGRKTWESIGKALPGRSNIVISRDPDYRAEGATVVTSLDAALSHAESVARIDGSEEVMIIGGAAIYTEVMPRLQRLYLTRVHADIDGDAMLNGFELSQWQEISRDRHSASEANPHDYTFFVYEKR